MTVAEQDIYIDRGADWSQSYVWTFSDTNQAVDLTSAAAPFTIRTSNDTINGTVLLQLTVGSGVTLSAGGSILVAMTHTQTAALPKGTFFYDAYVDFASGSQVRILQGQAVIT
jgi:hypothetical protein